MTPDKLAELFHETYERLAPAFGWRTKKGCNVPFAQLPQRNKALMVATCQTVLTALRDQGAAANVQPTNQGREPAEIISLCIGCVKENCSQRSELKCCPVTLCAMRQAK